jgi:hypothetical protein
LRRRHYISHFFLQVEFFQNNTFATIGGMGASTILRGKFYVIGDKKDQLWMQIWRFGFGRSVSGSVYSEGTYLSKDDEKTYWGRIEYVQDAQQDDSNQGDGSALPVEATNQSATSPSSLSDDNPRLIVKGSVIFGGNGLEPQPIGRFILTERTTSQSEDEEEDDDEEDDAPLIDLDASQSDDQPFFNQDDAFQ